METLQRIVIPSSLITFGFIVIFFTFVQSDRVNLSTNSRRLNAFIGAACVILGLILLYLFPVNEASVAITTIPSSITTTTASSPSSTSTTQIITKTALDTSPTVTLSTPVQSCKSITKEQFESIKQAPDLQTTIGMLQEPSSGGNYQSFKSGDRIISGRLISTTLPLSETNQLGLLPIKEQNGSGVYLTYSEYIAVSDGEYWCIK